MPSDYTLMNENADAHDSSPVCRVLRNYFATQAKRQEEIEEMRQVENGPPLHNPLATIGGNDVVQEG